MKGKKKGGTILPFTTRSSNCSLPFRIST